MSLSPYVARPHGNTLTNRSQRAQPPTNQYARQLQQPSRTVTATTYLHTNCNNIREHTSTNRAGQTLVTLPGLQSTNNRVHQPVVHRPATSATTQPHQAGVSGQTPGQTLSTTPPTLPMYQPGGLHIQQSRGLTCFVASAGSQNFLGGRARSRSSALRPFARFARYWLLAGMDGRVGGWLRWWRTGCVAVISGGRVGVHVG